MTWEFWSSDLIEQRRSRSVRGPYPVITEDGRQVTKHLLRLRFDDAVFVGNGRHRCATSP